MNWLINLYWDVRFKIEDKISDWKWNRELNKEDAPFVGEYNDNYLCFLQLIIKVASRQLQKF